MQWNQWDGWTAQDIEDRLPTLAQLPDADLFLTRGSWAGEGWNYLGLGPVREVCCDGPLGRDELREFVFQDPSPTLGFVGYSAGYRGLGTLVSPRMSGFPTAVFRKHRTLLRWRRDTGVVEGWGDASMSTEAAGGGGTVLTPGEASRHTPEMRASMTGPEYTDAVREVLRGIRRGEYYQLNLAIEFQTSLPAHQVPALFVELARHRPAPFYALMKVPPFQVLSTSPELFLRVRDGHVLSKPIKGTAEIRDDADPALRRLMESPKEAAELSMIVDLVRNDISSHCIPGSVQVRHHRSVFRVDRLWQACSEVHGRMNPESDVLDLLLDAFPGGSVTGCPKQAAMDAIRRFESFDRNLYCGTLFVIHDRTNMDTSIAIRTAVHDARRDEFRFYAGSGIVVDSDPDSEYQETLAKAAKFLESLRPAQKPFALPSQMQ
jgi:para-aminobenzoate synthetase component 1